MIYAHQGNVSQRDPRRVEPGNGVPVLSPRLAYRRAACQMSTCAGAWHGPIIEALASALRGRVCQEGRPSGR